MNLPRRAWTNEATSSIPLGRSYHCKDNATIAALHLVESMGPKALSVLHSQCRSVGRSASRRQTHPVPVRLPCRHTERLPCQHLCGRRGRIHSSRNTFGKRASPSPLIAVTSAIARAAPPAFCRSGSGWSSTSMFLDEEWLLLRLVKFWESYFQNVLGPKS